MDLVSQEFHLDHLQDLYLVEEEQVLITQIHQHLCKFQEQVVMEEVEQVHQVLQQFQVQQVQLIQVEVEVEELKVQVIQNLEEQVDQVLF